MSRTNKNRKKLPEYSQKMWKDSGHRIRKQAFLACDSTEYEDEPTVNWAYKPLSRHTSLRLHTTNPWDDVMTSFYKNKVNWKYPK